MPCSPRSKPDCSQSVGRWCSPDGNDRWRKQSTTFRRMPDRRLLSNDAIPTHVFHDRW
jgi:hypothetical protein